MYKSKPTNKNSIFFSYFNRLPMADLWDLYVNVPNQRLDLWMKVMSPFMYKKEVPFFDILVPTIDTTRFSYIMQKFMKINKPVLFIGATGI